jgi:hypothetical protein
LYIKVTQNFSIELLSLMPSPCLSSACIFNLNNLINLISILN